MISLAEGQILEGRGLVGLRALWQGWGMNAGWVWMFLGVVGLGAELPVRAPVEGRLHLVVPADSPPMVQVVCERGRVGSGSWLGDAAARERLSDVTFPVSWWKWTEIEVRFTPAADGEVALHLNGPWAEQVPGTLWRQELLWDEVRLGGRLLENGDFADGIRHWESPWGPYPEPGAWPLEREGHGASWHGRPLVRGIPVKKGVESVLALKVRAAQVPGFFEPRRLGGDTAAHRACARLKRGVNLGNHWEAPPGTWGVDYGLEDIDRIAAAGFDHVRVPVAWHFRMEDGGIDPAFLAELEPMLRRALDKGLSVILNWHHFDDLVRDPAAHRGRFTAGWGRIAEHFKDWPPGLYFELFNEPNGALDGGVLNEVHAEAIAGIRRSNPRRILMVNPGGWATVGKLGELRLPDDDDRIIVSVHCYDPFEFTHQGAGWVGLEPLKGVVFPGPPAEPLAVPEALRGRAGLAEWVAAYNTLPGGENPSSVGRAAALLREAAEWSAAFGRPVHLGEFGVYQTADPGSRERYARALREAAEGAGLPWCWWEWKAGFGVVDGTDGRELLIDALVPGR